MRKVFISYSSKDREWVTGTMLPRLEAAGIPCHIDYRDFEIGPPVVLNIERAYATCEKTIVVASPNWLESEWTQFELTMYQTDDPRNLKKRLLPVIIKECTLPPGFKIYTPAYFTDEQNWDTEFERLIRQIKTDFAAAGNGEKKNYPPLPEDAIDIVRLPETGFQLFGRQSEIALLDKTWADHTTNVIGFIAYGGVGKSTLVRKWIEKLRWENYHGAERIFAWSFYSQGTNEYATSADIFINAALIWFGDEHPDAGSPWDKGKRLARLVNRQRTLLILDGLEPLQSGLEIDRGTIKDPALSFLVRELAKTNAGLCVITTRERLPELDRYGNKAAQIDLEQITDDAGIKLLELRGICGSSDSCLKAVRGFGSHALAVNLLAAWLHQFPGHSVEPAFTIPDIDIPVEKGRYPRRMIEAFANSPGINSAAFELLSILGLFDRSVEKEAVDAVIAGPVIPGLTQHLSQLSADEWYTLLDKLRNHKLLIEKSTHRPKLLDSHPLIREHFGEKLQKQNPEEWRAAHTRLYEYYKNLPEKELPDTLTEMEPLFTAVRHGCMAVKHQEAMDDVFRKRILRRNEAYIVHKLGAFGAFLACLSHFFESPWDKVASGLTEPAKAAVLSWAGFALRALGRLTEAIQPMKAGLEMRIEQNDWKNTAQDANNLSELFLTLGRVKEAGEYGEQSVDFADKSGDGFWMEASRTDLPDAFFQAGRIAEAESLFVAAEEMQKKRQPEYPYLYFLRGFRYCDLLLFQGKYEEVLKRAKETIKIAERSHRLLAIALDNLSIGKALLWRAISKKSIDISEAESFLCRAADGLREAGTQHRLPWGLLARAPLYRHKHDFALTWSDLDEAREIAGYGGMKLHLTDYFLESCRVIREQLAANDFTVIENGELRTLSKADMEAKYSEFLSQAKALVEETGYHRRDAELKELETATTNLR